MLKIGILILMREAGILKPSIYYQMKPREMQNIL